MKKLRIGKNTQTDFSNKKKFRFFSSFDIRHFVHIWHSKMNEKNTKFDCSSLNKNHVIFSSEGTRIFEKVIWFLINFQNFKELKLEKKSGFFSSVSQRVKIKLLKKSEWIFFSQNDAKTNKFVWLQMKTFSKLWQRHVNIN